MALAAQAPGWLTNFWWSTNIAEWVGGAATTTALVLAVLAFRSDRRATRDANALTRVSLLQTNYALQLQAQRDLRDQDDRAQAQAALVSVGTNHRPGDTSHGVSIKVTNRSPVPIYDVHTFVNTAATISRQHIGVIGPNGDETKGDETNVNRAALSTQFCGATFRDNAGAHWIKWGDGILIRATADQISTLSPKDIVINDDNRAQLDPRAAFLAGRYPAITPPAPAP